MDSNKIQMNYHSKEEVNTKSKKNTHTHTHTHQVP